MLKNDKWISEQAKLEMIVPFAGSLVRQIKDRRVISYGLFSYEFSDASQVHSLYVFNPYNARQIAV